MGHKCNPFCFGGLHAILYDVESTEIPHLKDAGAVLAAQNGFEYAGHTLVQAPGSAPVGTPTRYGVARGRVIVWGRGF